VTRCRHAGTERFLVGAGAPAWARSGQGRNRKRGSAAIRVAKLSSLWLPIGSWAVCLMGLGV
jgi:hypothetical protein